MEKALDHGALDHAVLLHEPATQVHSHVLSSSVHSAVWLQLQSQIWVLIN
jgi:hypothetical protein